MRVAAGEPGGGHDDLPVLRLGFGRQVQTSTLHQTHIEAQATAFAVGCRRHAPASWKLIGTLISFCSRCVVALVVLLRGVNVGGHRTFRPSTLAKKLKHLEIVNIGAAGTFVVRRSVPQAQVRAEFARALPFDTEIVICQGREIVRLDADDVFSGHPPRPDIVRFLSVLSRRPREALPMPMVLPATGKWWMKLVARDSRFVFGLYRRDMKAIGYLGTLDRIFGVPVTTRNWNTVTSIARVLEDGKLS